MSLTYCSNPKILFNKNNSYCNNPNLRCVKRIYARYTDNGTELKTEVKTDLTTSIQLT